MGSSYLGYPFMGIADRYQVSYDDVLLYAERLRTRSVLLVPGNPGSDAVTRLSTDVRHEILNLLVLPTEQRVGYSAQEVMRYRRQAQRHEHPCG
jgi:hypothetical protein